MSRLKSILAAGAVLIGGLALTPVTQGETMTETSAIQAAVDRMTTAFANHDVDGILATYEPEAAVVGEPGNPSRGSPALRDLFAQFIAANPTFTFLDHEIVTAKDLALHLSHWKMIGTAPDGTVIEDGGLSVVVLRRQTDGQWLMVIDNPYGDHVLKR